MMTRPFRLLSIAAGLVAGAMAHAGAQSAVVGQTRPDFTGTWVLDTTRSNRDGVLVSLTLTVARSGDTLSVLSEGVNAGGSFSARVQYGPDGTPLANSLRGVTLFATFRWEGATMILSSNGDAGGTKMSVDDRWSLDGGGQTLTRRSSLTANGQNRSETLVFTKR